MGDGIESELLLNSLSVTPTPSSYSNAEIDAFIDELKQEITRLDGEVQTLTEQLNALDSRVGILERTMKRIVKSYKKLSRRVKRALD